MIHSASINVAITENNNEVNIKYAKDLNSNNILHDNVDYETLPKDKTWIKSRSVENEIIIIKPHSRLLSLKTLFVIFVWYFFSFVAIFLSKYLIDYKGVDITLFCYLQLVASTIMAWLNLQCNRFKEEVSIPKDFWSIVRDFYQSIALIGFMRLLVIYFGLISMKFVALSFMETVKSSAPLFTVVISYLVLRERSGLAVQCSLMPIMIGLMLCCAHEISFNWIGFLAALVANVAECFQFVLSKVFLGSNAQKMNPHEFQFHTSLAALLINLPFTLFFVNANIVLHLTPMVMTLMIVTGLCYYFQTMMAWLLMEFLSPVTHSIFNTIKCGMAVWLSVILFSNHVTLFSGFGSCIVISGVLAYQKARNLEKQNQSGEKSMEFVLVPE